jgi:HlyD family secretion protein
MTVGFTVDAYPGQHFEGVVRQVRDAAVTVQNVVTYDAVIDVDNSKRLLKPGMTATVTFTPAEKNDVLRIPNAALRFRPEPAAGASARSAGPRPSTPTKPEPGKKTVYRLNGTRAEPVEIRIGLTDGSLTELTSGDIHEKDQVITEMITDQAAAPAAAPPGGGFPRGAAR